MKSVVEYIRAARHIEVFVIVVLFAVLGLLLLNGTGKPADRTDDEARLARLLEGIDGVIDVDVMIATDADGKPMGVAVVTGGQLDISARLQIQSAIQALMDIDLNRIRIIGKGG